jgi:hypothetical protein
MGEQHALVSGGLMRWAGWVHGALVQAQVPIDRGPGAILLGPIHLKWRQSNKRRRRMHGP